VGDAVVVATAAVGLCVVGFFDGATVAGSTGDEVANPESANVTLTSMGKSTPST